MTRKKDQENSLPAKTKKTHLPFASAQLIFWPIFILALASDLWTKHTVFDWLSDEPGSYYDIIKGFFRFVLVENPGAAWGIASGQRLILSVISIAACLGIFAMLFLGKTTSRHLVVLLATFQAGICGNLYDRLFNDGKVRDFLDFYYNDWHFPAFNIADSLLTVSVALLMLMTIFEYPSKTQKTDDLPED